MQDCLDLTGNLCAAAGLVVDRTTLDLVSADACKPICRTESTPYCVAQRESRDQVVQVSPSEGGAISAGIVAAVASTCALALLVLLLIVILAYR